jgi:hypothetical protein
MNKRVILPILAAVLAGFGAAMACALVLAVVDIYLAGHGQATLGRAWIDGAFVHMSRGDCILMVVSIASALFAGWGARRARWPRAC